LKIKKNATVEMAIVDFFYCKNIPDAVVELPRFLWLVCVCRLVGDDFAVSNQKRIGGELLDLNYTNVYQQNKEELLKEAKVFGLAFMATIHKMPLMNILAMSGTIPPMTISIQDCMKHMVKGGKKDESYIANLFKEKVLEYDPLQICTSVFFFDGGLNVQKAGEVLMARFPRTVDSLFFSSITKVKPIKIFHIFAPFYYLQSIDTPFFLFVEVLILKTCCLYSVFGLM
jgi:hypothetical protein